MKINLIHPPQYGVIDDRLDPPLGLMAIAANLIKEGFDNVSITDLSGIEENQWVIPFSDLYGITVYSPSIYIAKAIAKKCKEINSKSIVVCGGIHATILPETLLDDTNIDSVVRGYGEKIMVIIAKNLPKIEKIYEGKIDSLLELPIPARHLVKIESYSRLVKNYQAFNIQTTRGCPFLCSFCSEHVLTKKVLYRNIDSIHKEILDIKTNYGGKALFVYDDIFTINKKRLLSILQLFSSEKMTFDFHMRADSVSYHECVLLKESGGNIARLGIESFSDDILIRMNKGIKRQTNIDAVKKVKDSGLVARIFIIFGFPGETDKTVDETIRGIEEADPDQIFLSTFVPFPGCSVWNNPAKYGITKIELDYSKYSFVSDMGKGNIVFDTIYTDRDRILLLQDKMYKYVYSRNFRGDNQGYFRRLLSNIKLN